MASALRASADAERLYQYQELPSGDFIRYMVLRPDARGSLLICSLHTAHIDQVPPFEAISYVWGSTVKPSTIVCEGKILHITRNLWLALQTVRSTDQPRTLWADSICINQENTTEKGRQVQLMGPIYRRSTRTLICLGPDDSGEAAAAAGLISDLDKMITDTFRDIEPAWNAFPWPTQDDLRRLASDPRWSTFVSLSRQVWFTRGWVIQETSLGSEAHVFWGDTRIDWVAIMRAYTWLVRRANSIRATLELLWILLVASGHLRG